MKMTRQGKDMQGQDLSGKRKERARQGRRQGASTDTTARKEQGREKELTKGELTNVLGVEKATDAGRKEPTAGYCQWA